MQYPRGLHTCTALFGMMTWVPRIVPGHGRCLIQVCCGINEYTPLIPQTLHSGSSAGTPQLYREIFKSTEAENRQAVNYPLRESVKLWGSSSDTTVNLYSKLSGMFYSYFSHTSLYIQKESFETKFNKELMKSQGDLMMVHRKATSKWVSFPYVS